MSTTTILLNNGDNQGEDSAFLMLCKRNGSWSVPRSPVPALLESRGVPAELWEATYDTVVKKQEQHGRDLEFIRKWSRVALIPSILAAVLLLCFSKPMISFFNTDFDDSDDGEEDEDSGRGYGVVIFLLDLIGLPPLVYSVFMWMVGKRYNFNSDKCAMIAEWNRFIQNEQQVLYEPYGVSVNSFKYGPVNARWKKMLVGGLMFRVAEEQYRDVEENSQDNESEMV